MSIKVNPKLTQTENLYKMLENSNIDSNVLGDIDSFSVLKRNNEFGGFTTNTELHLHITPNSSTHYKEKKAYAESNYNRVSLGFVGDDDYVFEYNEDKFGTIDLSSNNDFINIRNKNNLNKMVNSFPLFSQDVNYPFSAELIDNNRKIKITAHMSSPCYFGYKIYPIRIIKSVSDFISKEIYLSSRIFHPYSVDKDFIINNRKRKTIITSETVKFNKDEKITSNNVDDLIKGVFKARNDYYLDTSFLVNKSEIITRDKLLIDSNKTDKYLLEDPSTRYSIHGLDDPIWLESNSRNNSINIFNVKITNPNYNEVINLYIVRRHLSELFLKYLEDTNKALGVIFNMGDVQGYHFTVPNGGDVHCRFTGFRTNNLSEGIMFNFEVLNGLKDKIIADNLFEHRKRPGNHTYYLIKIIYSDFIRYVKEINTSLGVSLEAFGSKFESNIHFKDRVLSDEKDNLLEFGLSNYCLFIGGKLLINCKFFINHPINSTDVMLQGG